MKGIVISTANKIQTTEIPENGHPLYDLVRGVVGGHMENVYPRRLDSNLIMVVNEEGLLMDLPVNPVASYLYGMDIHGQPIVGNVIILKKGYFEGEPDIVGIPDNEAETIIETLNKTIFSILKGANL